MAHSGHRERRMVEASCPKPLEVASELRTEPKSHRFFQVDFDVYSTRYKGSEIGVNSRFDKVRICCQCSKYEFRWYRVNYVLLLI